MVLEGIVQASKDRGSHNASNEVYEQQQGPAWHDVFIGAMVPYIPWQ